MTIHDLFMPGVKAKVSDAFGVERWEDGKKVKHRGVDLVFGELDEKRMPEYMRIELNAELKAGYYKQYKTTIVSPKDGKVIKSAFSATAGNWVWVQTGDNYILIFMHLKKRLVNVGDIIFKNSTQIGYMGNTGNSTGVHLHFEVWKDERFGNGVLCDPVEWLNNQHNGTVSNYSVDAKSESEILDIKLAKVKATIEDVQMDYLEYRTKVINQMLRAGIHYFSDLEKQSDISDYVYDGIFKVNIDSTDATRYITEFSLTSSIDALSDCLKISTSNDGVPSFPIYSDVVVNGIFEGKIISISKDNDTISYTCYDNMWNLNKTQMLIQISDGVSVGAAISLILNKCGIKYMLSTLLSVKTVESKIYKDTPYNIIKKLLEIAEAKIGKSFYMTCYKNIIIIEMLGLKTVKLSGFINSISGETSVEDVKNSFIYLTGSESDGYTEELVKIFPDSISSYGKIVEYITSQGDTDDAATIMANIDARRTRPKQTGTIELNGVWAAMRGKSLYIDDEKSGLSGYMNIISASHKVDKGLHTMSLSLEEY